MTHDELERRLRSESAADSAFVPRALPASAADARAVLGRPPGAGRLLFATAAVAAAAVALVVVVTTFTSAPFGDPGPGASVPASAEAGQPCGADDLLISMDPWGAAMGSRGTTVVFRVRDATASCSLPEVVEARISDGTGTVLVSGRSPRMPAMNLPSGSQVEAAISWSNWCGTPPTGMSLMMRFTDEWIPIGPADSGIIVPPCMGVGQPSALNVTAFEPSERPPLR